MIARRLFYAVAIGLTAFATSAVAAAYAAPQTVYVVDRSTVVPLAQVQNALPAFQQAVSQDFAPVWGQDAQLVITDTPPATGWTIVIRDQTDYWGALGYHGMYRGTPWGRVFAKTTLDNGETWQGVFTHELFELLADPYINRFVHSTRFWLVEVADPVEADAHNYSRPAADGSAVPISDFVTPAWYRRWGHAPFDFGGHIQKPFQILPGGYASYWANGWHSLSKEPKR